MPRRGQRLEKILLIGVMDSVYERCWKHCLHGLCPVNCSPRTALHYVNECWIKRFLPPERAHQRLQRVALLQHAYHCCRRFLQWTARVVKSVSVSEHGAVSASVRMNAAGWHLFWCDARQRKHALSSIYNKVALTWNWLLFEIIAEARLEVRD